MSLSWLDRLTLHFGPQRVGLERRSWGGGVECRAVAVPAAESGEADWQPALRAAASLLAADSGGGRLRVVVANHFVRFALLPWSERVLGDKARRAVARALLQHNLGEAAARLDIALDRAAFGLNGLAAGIDRELLDGLRRIARERRLRLAAIQPQLTAELAAARRMLDDGCVVISEPGWLTLAGLRHGDLCLLRNHRAAATPAGQAGELLAMLAADFPAPMAATADPAVDRKILRIFTTDPWPENLGDWQVECHAPLAAGVGGA